MAIAEVNPVAFYGAVLSTVVAAWNVYQWWSKGPKLVGSISTNMVTYGGIPHDDNTYAVITVSNRGDAPTTITNLGLLSYTNWWTHFRGKNIRAAIIQTGGNLGSAIPFQLIPGGEFRGFAIQNAELEKWSKEQLLFMCVWHTMANKPFRARIMPIEQKNGDASA